MNIPSLFKGEIVGISEIQGACRRITIRTKDNALVEARIEVLEVLKRKASDAQRTS